MKTKIPMTAIAAAAIAVTLLLLFIYDYGLSTVHDDRYSEADSVLMAGPPIDCQTETEDSAEMFEEYLPAAEQGDAAAQNKVGAMYQRGHGVEKNYEEAIAWYKRAAEQDYVPAQMCLAEYYRYVRGRHSDRESLKWYKKAAESGEVEAQIYLGRKHMWFTYSPNPNYVEAAKWFRMAAAQGNAEAQNSLGDIYAEGGYGIAKDEKEAVKWYRLAAEQGHAEAGLTLGYMYSIGSSLKLDDAEAAKWYLKTARQEAENNTLERSHINEARHNLVFMYIRGRAVVEDDAEVLTWYEQVAGRGGEDAGAARLHLGMMYLEGRGVAKDEDQAVYWLDRAWNTKALELLTQLAEQGNVAAQESRGLRDRDETRQYIVEVYESRIEDAGRRAEYYAGKFGEAEVAKARADAEQYRAEVEAWLMKVVKRDGAHALSELGDKYAEGHGRIFRKNDAKAADLYRQAADMGYAPAQNMLGVMYEDGRGVKQNDAEAVRWYRLAAEQGNAPAQNNLGTMYADGRGIERNDVEAVRWYRLAAHVGYAPAEYNLGKMYAEGRGVTKDKVEAERLYRLAAEQGHKPAQAYFGKEYEEKDNRFAEFLEDVISAHIVGLFYLLCALNRLLGGEGGLCP